MDTCVAEHPKNT